jgi:hypothetical protein
MTVAATGDHPSYTAFVSRATADPTVVGLVLSGSRAHESGMVTAHSDYDIEVVVSDTAVDAWERRRERILDIAPVSLSQFMSEPPEDLWLGGRYAYANSLVLLDRSAGHITETVHRRGTLTPTETHKWSREMLDAYVNAAYRVVKNHRNGLPFEAHMDSATAVSILSQVPFLLEGKPPPFPKYLAWELRHRPLADPAWQADRLIPQLQRLLDTADLDVHHAVFEDVERVARAAGHGDVLEAWGDDLELLRPT